MLTSTEIRIQQKLVELNCAGSNLAAINGKISQSRLSRALAGQKPLENLDGFSLLETLNEMAELARESRVFPDWSQHDSIRQALEARRLAHKVIREEQLMGIGD